MQARFIGKFDNKVDDKLRVSVPSSFRQTIRQGHPGLEDGKPASFYMILDELDSVVECMTIDEYARVAEAIDEEEDDAVRRLLEIRHFTFAQMVTLDGSGRIQFTPAMRKMLGDAPSLVFAGENHAFQILAGEGAADEAAADAILAEARALREQIPAGKAVRGYGRRRTRKPETAPA